MATSVAGRPAQTGIRSPETITVYDGDGHTMAEGISGVDVQAPMIGREKELRFLEDHLDTAAKGKGSLVLVSGEAGIGKTRLVEELKSVASARGFLVLSAYGLYESLTPFMPFREALRAGGLDQLFAEDAPRIESMYLVANSGLLVMAARREEAPLDSDLFASMLATVERFVQDSLSKLGGGEKDGGMLTRLDYGGHSILLERGPSVHLVAVVDGRENEFLIRDLHEAIAQVHETHGRALEAWDGDEERVRGIDEPLKPLLARYDGVRYGESNPQGRRNLLFENVCLGLARQAETNPILLCVEDLQWADPSTLALMQYVARNTRKCAMCIVGTYRPEDLSAGEGRPHPLVDATQRMEREGLFETLELQRLPVSDTAKALISLLRGGEVSEELVRRIHESTEGNPLFLVELVKLMLEEGLLQRDSGGWSARGKFHEIDIPRRVQAIIQRRLGRLGNAERQALDVAAINGEEFSLEVVATALGRDPIALQSTLRALEQRHRLIRTREGRYRFDHVKIKDSLCEDMSPEFRLRCHGLVAAAMEAHYQDRLDDVAGEIAFHYLGSKDRAKALPYLRRAADRAAKQYANAEAIRFYTEALELDLDGTTRIELLDALGALYELTGRFGEALVCHNRALGLSSAPEKRAESLAKIGRLLVKKGELEESVKACTTALALVKGDETVEAALVLSSLGIARWRLGEYEQALVSHRKSLEISERIGDQRGIAVSLGNLGNVHIDRGEYEQALVSHRKSLEISERIGLQRGIGLGLNSLGIVHRARGEYEQAMTSFRTVLEVAERVGDHGMIGIALNNLGVVHFARGEYEQAMTSFRKGLEVAERIGDQHDVSLVLNSLGNVHEARGEYEQAMISFRKGLEVAERIGDQLGMAMNLVGHGRLHEQLGDLAAANDSAQRGLQVADGIGSHEAKLEAQLLLSEVQLKMGDLEKARDVCSLAFSASTHAGVRARLTESRRILGMIEREREGWAESTKTFEESVRTAKELGIPLTEGTSRYEFGLMWKQKGDRGRAVEQLSAAVGIFERIGAAKWLERAQEALRDVGG